MLGGVALEVALFGWRLEGESFIMLLRSERLFALPHAWEAYVPGAGPPSSADKLEACRVDGVGFLSAF